MPEFPVLPAMADQPLSVVLLARDAAGHVESLLPKWIAYLETLGRSKEIILADDASKDGTAERAERFVPHIKILRREGTPAEGLTLRSALDRCRYPLVFTTRLLPRYLPVDLTRMLTEKRTRRFDTGAACSEIDVVHLVTGYRVGRPVPAFWSHLGSVWRAIQRVLLGTNPTPLPGWLGLRGHLAGLLWRGVFGIRNRDAFCPVRLFRRELLPRLALQSTSSFVHVEILAKATFLGRILSEDIPVGERKRGQFADAATEYLDPPGAIARDFRALWACPDFGPATIPAG